MTAPDDAVAAIDAALEAWESGPDAYQWEPDAEPGEARGVRPNLLAEYGAMMPTQAEIERIGEQMRRAMEGFRVSVQHLAARYREITIAEQNAPTGVGNSSRVPESTNTPEGPQNGAQGRTGALPEGADPDDDVDTIGWAASRQAWEEQAQWWPEMPQ